MSRWKFSARTVIEEPEASKSVDALSEDLKRFNDTYEGLKWLLARSCEALPSTKRTVKGEEFHIMRRADGIMADNPDIVVLYQYDQDTVTIIDVKVVSDSCDDG